jgi:hypothetical protein
MLFFLSSFIDGYIPLKNIFTKKATFLMTRPYIKSMINDTNFRTAAGGVERASEESFRRRGGVVNVFRFKIAVLLALLLGNTRRRSSLK